MQNRSRNALCDHPDNSMRTSKTNPKTKADSSKTKNVKKRLTKELVKRRQPALPEAAQTKVSSTVVPETNSRELFIEESLGDAQQINTKKRKIKLEDEQEGDQTSEDHLQTFIKKEQINKLFTHAVDQECLVKREDLPLEK